MLVYGRWEKVILNKQIKFWKCNKFFVGWHNYHHVFPWDYKTAELPGYFFNLSTAFIDFFAWLGMATELKTVPDEIIKRRLLRTGDGSHSYAKLEKKEQNNNLDDEKLRTTENFWGWVSLKKFKIKCLKLLINFKFLG